MSLWSSSENSVNNAWNCNSNNTNVNNNNKNNNNDNNRVRAFSAFPRTDFHNLITMREYPNGIPLVDVFNAYYECRKHKRRTDSQVLFEINLESNVIDLWREINERTYEIGASTCFCITRPKLREVFAADFRDRIVHHVIMQRLESLFEKEFIEDNYNCRKGKGTLYGVNRLNDKLSTFTDNYTKDAWIGKFDIKGFFMAIDKTILLQRVNAFINTKYNAPDKDLLLWLVNIVISNRPQDNCIMKGDTHLWDNLPKNKSLFTCNGDKGLPIGNLTSQIFGNFYLNEFDKWLEKEFEGGYGRYVDDFYLISNDKKKILNAVPRIKAYLKDRLKLDLHDDKIYVQQAYHGTTYIGGVIKRGRIYIGNSSVSRLYDLIAYYNKRVSKDKAEDFVSRLNSYMGFMRHNKSYAIKTNALKQISPEWWDYMELSKDSTKIILTQTTKSL